MRLTAIQNAVKQFVTLDSIVFDNAPAIILVYSFCILISLAQHLLVRTGCFILDKHLFFGFFWRFWNSRDS